MPGLWKLTISKEGNQIDLEYIPKVREELQFFMTLGKVMKLSFPRYSIFQWYKTVQLPSGK